MGATTIIAVESIPERVASAKRLGADIVIDFNKEDPVAEILKLTGGRGVGLAIEALGLPETFEACLL
jgi:threonine dehydrogenase-like Zn-dependent dehydrogenase